MKELNEWWPYAENDMIFMPYHLDELLKVVNDNGNDERYSKLLELFATCSLGRQLIATAIGQRQAVDPATYGRHGGVGSS